MISIIKTDVSDLKTNIVEYRGLSKDTKPTGEDVGNGSVFIEIDTGKMFFFDYESKTWKEV